MGSSTLRTSSKPVSKFPDSALVTDVPSYNRETAEPLNDIFGNIHREDTIFPKIIFGCLIGVIHFIAQRLYLQQYQHFEDFMALVFFFRILDRAGP